MTPKNCLKTQESTQKKHIKIFYHKNLFKKVHLIYAFKKFFLCIFNLFLGVIPFYPIKLSLNQKINVHIF
jgi:hypothetical protein